MDTSDFPGSMALFWIKVALLISMLIPNLDTTIHSVEQDGWYGSASFLTFASFQSTWGKTFKYFAIKSTFLVPLFIFELGRLINAVAPSSTALITGRAIAGASAAGASSSGSTLLF